MRYVLPIAFAFSALLIAGCDQLFPELTGANDDLTVITDAAADAGGVDVLVGRVCLLGDLRAPSTCQTAAPGRHVTIEETRVGVDVAADGTFTIPLTGVTTQATLAVTDGTASTGTTPTISVLSGAALTTALTQGVALPAITASTMNALDLATGAPTDASRGAIIGWVLDSSGAAVKGASVPAVAGATGPLYDSTGSQTLTLNGSTGTYGAIGFLDLPPGSETLMISPPATSALAAQTFTLPVRGGAVTVSVLALPLL